MSDIILIGDARNELKDELVKTLDDTLNAYSSKYDTMWLIIHTYWSKEYEGLLQTKVYVSLRPGVPMLGTMGFFCDSRAGTIKQAWCKPMDGPQWEKEELLSEVGVERVGAQALETGTILHD